MTSNFWEAGKAMLKRNLQHMTLNTYVRKEKKYKINNLSLHFCKQEKVAVEA